MRPEAVAAVQSFLISVGVCTVPLVPVMVFTFMGLTGSPYIRETSALFAGFIQTRGLILGLLLASLSNVLTAAVILGFVHLVFYRPGVFQDSQQTAFARKLVAAGMTLFLLFWGQKFFLDGYHDMMVLGAAGIGSMDFQWAVFLSCLCVFTLGLAYWLVKLVPQLRVTGERQPFGGLEQTPG